MLEARQSSPLLLLWPRTQSERTQNSGEDGESKGRNAGEGAEKREEGTEEGKGKECSANGCYDSENYLTPDDREGPLNAGRENDFSIVGVF